MLAERLPGILPPMTDEEALGSAAIQSLGSGGFRVEQWMRRPFRSPHHTASAVSLVGGGSNPRPGEISMAMNGVLFLDELPEFDRDVLEVLREPLESGRITISRAARQAEFPARFQLVAAMNPCPCGFLGHYSGKCHCTPDQVARYRRKISGPLLDRIDLHVEVPAVPPDEMAARPGGRQQRGDSCARRSLHASVSSPAKASPTRSCRPARSTSTRSRTAPAEQVLKQAISRLGLSARGYHRVLKVARTIADLAGAEAVTAAHVAEAVQYRRLEKA